jgi:hypothetical protein
MIFIQIERGWLEKGTWKDLRKDWLEYWSAADIYRGMYYMYKSSSYL